MNKFFLCFACLLFTAGASAQALWQGVPVGATVAEVRALVPEVQAPATSPASGRDGVLLEIPAVELAAAAFKVSFVFQAERLQRVTLLANAGSADEARALAQRLTTSLRSRYGLEMSTKSRGATASLTIDRQWNFRRTVVHLEVVDGSFVRLDYSGQTPVRNNRL